MSGIDWRALCAELLADYEEHLYRSVLADRARAALAAEAVGEGPTGDAAVEAVAELIYNQAMKWAATQPIPSDHINIPAWQQGGNSDAQEVARRTARAALAAKPLVKGPTDEELLELWQGWNLGWDPQKGMVLMPHPAEYARAVLARYGHQPAPAAETDAILALAAIIREVDGNHSLGAAALAEAILSHRDSRWGQQPAPPAEGAPGPSMEEVGPLIAWLTEQACQAADASQPTDAGMLTWAAQVIGERVDEDAPAPPVAGEVAELVRWLRGANWDGKRQSLATRAADLLERQAAPVLEPALARINDILNDSGRILQTDELEALELARQALEQRQAAPVPVSERLPGPEDCDAEGRCWVGYPELTYSIADTGDTDTTTPEWRLEHQPLKPKGSRCCWLPATALPLPAGEVE